ncbi:hypothetical protein FISHEDRAFT_71863 [Fistulina hepatica ATCC 64428]|uniref:FAD-binding domain-containing protein n=1 Tax=Fistulina hepatica ATCC 64428 TaxID=1128425 RepID=A0A0D7AIV7_9AGAR|nr:hypothetical protein FISHEDRAFT_71863 [Fistulina hepatica ATCC 64428]
MEWAMLPRIQPPEDKPYVSSNQQWHLRCAIFFRVDRWINLPIVQTNLAVLGQEEAILRRHLERERGPDEGNEKVETARYGYMAGADAAPSMIRKRMGFMFDGKTRYDESMIVMDGRVLEGSTMSTSLHPCETPTEEWCNCYLWGKTDVARNPENAQEVLDMFYQIMGRHDVKFASTAAFGKFVRVARLMAHMGSILGNGRIFIAGDAQHARSPAGGQGMNTGAQGAANLRWKLALVVKRLAPSHLLETYSIERLRVITEMLKRSDKLLNNIFTPGALHDMAFHQLGVSYCHSSIILDGAAPAHENALDSRPPTNPYNIADHLRAGDRSPDAILHQAGEDVRLHSFFSLRFHRLLVFTDDPALAKAFVGLAEGHSGGLARRTVIVAKEVGAKIKTSLAGPMTTLGLPIRDMRQRVHVSWSSAKMDSSAPWRPPSAG